MELVRARHIDPFEPVLLNTETQTLDVTPEQSEYIKDILNKACSDSRFAQKAYASIMLVLTVGPTAIPEVTSLNPTTAVLGSESFLLRVSGKNFDEGSQIIWNGSPETTTRISDTELTTGVDMSTAAVAIDLPVIVQNSKGVMSEPMTFSLTDPATRTSEKSELEKRAEQQRLAEVQKKTEAQRKAETEKGG